MKLFGELFGKPLAKAEREKETQPSHDAPQSIQSPVVGLGYRYVGGQLIGAVLAVVVMWQYFKSLADWNVPFLIVFVSFFALVALRLLVFGKTLFQAVPPKIIREWRFLGLIPVWRRESPLKKYTRVQRRHVRGRGRRGRTIYSWQVGLVGPFDDFLLVQFFNSRGYDYPCPEADAFASHLAEVTGLPLLEPIQV